MSLERSFNNTTNLLLLGALAERVRAVLDNTAKDPIVEAVDLCEIDLWCCERVGGCAI